MDAMHELTWPALAAVAAMAAGAPGLPREGTARSADGVDIHYRVVGTGEPALVFVHGWAIDSRYWDAQVPAFARDQRVVTLDLAGHGRSGRGRKDWTVAAFAQDVRAVVEALGLGKVILVGHSMSGNVIVEAAVAMPDRVVGLVPVDTLLDVDQVASAEQVAGMTSALRADYPKAADGFMRQYMFTAATPPALVEEIVKDAVRFPPEIAVPILENLWRHDPRPALRRVTAPIVAVNADKFPTRLDHARAYAPRFDAVIVEGTGHYLMREKPERFNQRLAEAVARVREEAASAPR
jgi:pimeloyl-ACP methyl ester carboxylesterase